VESCVPLVMDCQESTVNGQMAFGDVGGSGRANFPRDENILATKEVLSLGLAVNLGQSAPCLQEAANEATVLTMLTAPATPQRPPSGMLRKMKASEKYAS